MWHTEKQISATYAEKLCSMHAKQKFQLNLKKFMKHKYISRHQRTCRQ